MKKLLLGLGTTVAILTPVATIIACSTTEATDTPATKDINSSKSEAELKAILATAITTIDTANSELGIMIPALVGSSLKTITWDSGALKLTVVTTATGTQTDTTTIYTIVPTVMFYDLNATTKVKIVNNAATNIHITVATTTSNTIALNYQPGAYVNEEVAKFLKDLTSEKIGLLLTYTFTGFEGNGLSGDKEVIVNAILASVKPAAN